MSQRQVKALVSDTIVSMTLPAESLFTLQTLLRTSCVSDTAPGATDTKILELMEGKGRVLCETNRTRAGKERVGILGTGQGMQRLQAVKERSEWTNWANEI